MILILVQLVYFSEVTLLYAAFTLAEVGVSVVRVSVQASLMITIMAYKSTSQSCGVNFVFLLKYTEIYKY